VSGGAALLPRLLPGLGVTCGVTLGAAALAVPAALAAGLLRAQGPAPARAAAAVYVEVFRGTSALVQLFWAYFALPLLGLRLPAGVVAVLVLGLNIGAYGAEVVRGALEAVPAGQREAAAALGLSPRQALRQVVLPQAAPAMLPPAGNLLIELLKATALVSLITMTDLTFQAKVLQAETLQTAELFGLVLVLYFLLAQLLAGGVRVLERRVAPWRQAPGAP